jgi:hypothetical protein
VGLLYREAVACVYAPGKGRRDLLVCAGNDMPRERQLTALEQSLMAENDTLSAENSAFRQADSMEVKTRFGSIKAGGPVAVIIFCIVISALFGGYMQWDHNHQNIDRANDIKNGQKDIVQAQKRVEDALDSAAYILTLDENQRKALKMDMPDSLRRKIQR